MTSTPLLAVGVSELAAGVTSGVIDPLDVLTQFERSVQQTGAAGELNALIHLDVEGARGDCASIHAGGTVARQGALAGVPVVVKDNIATLRMPTSCGSRILAGYVSPFEATAVQRIRAAGGLLVAKSNMDEFGMGSSTENSAFGPTRNPRALDRVPGGSSGGSAAAVAAGAVRIALGSETGGSVRQPAAFCGIVGVKPTYGRVSRHGLVAFASSLDQIGVFGASVQDAAIALQVISGHDPHDATSAAREVPSFLDQAAPVARASARSPLRGMVVGIPREYFPEQLHPGIADRCHRAAGLLQALGAEIRSVSLPHTEFAIPVYYILAPAEASSNLARFDGVRYGVRQPGKDLRHMYEATRSGGFGPEVTRRILLGTYVLSAGYYDAYYRRAQQVRRLITADFDAVFAQGIHLLLTPTTPTTAFEFGSRSDPYEMYLSDSFTVTANLAGLPAMSLPVGRVEGLPVGAQLIAPAFDEPTMFRIALALQEQLGEEAHR